MTDPFQPASIRNARDARKEAHLRGILDHYTAQFRAIASHDAPSVARGLHTAIDNVLERDRLKGAASGAIQCRKGCSHCCHGPVEIWPHEAALLVAISREAGTEMDRALLERQNHYTMDAWRYQPLADTACVFLGDDGACKVYASRPNACRKLLVTTDPELCDAQKHPLESVVRWRSWEAEILETAALEVFGGELMPRSLLTALDASDRCSSPATTQTLPPMSAINSSA